MAGQRNNKKVSISVGLHHHWKTAIVVAVGSTQASTRRVSRYGFQEFGDRPYVICDSGCHSRSGTKAAVKMAVVVPSEMQGQGCFQVLPLSGEGIGQARQSANVHPHREVLPFNVRRTNSLRVWFPPDW